MREYAVRYKLLSNGRTLYLTAEGAAVYDVLKAEVFDTLVLAEDRLTTMMKLNGWLAGLLNEKVARHWVASQHN